MKSARHLCSATDVNVERKFIRVDVPSAHAGITAALRRAFAPVEDRCRAGEFETLLDKLN
jgi:hypothetical protein